MKLKFIATTNKSIFHINIIGIFIYISSSNEINSRLVIQTK